MTRLPLFAVASLALALHASPAHAIASCSGGRGWATAAGATVPRRAHLVYFTTAGVPADVKVVATIDGKPVPAKLTQQKSAPFTFLVVDIDSPARAGKLTVTLMGTTSIQLVIGDVAMPKTVAATPSHFHSETRHTSGTETYDSLLVSVSDAPAVMAHVKIRRDDKAPWSELDVPVTHYAKDKASFELGLLGCASNYEPALLLAGVDLEASVTLLDGTTRPLADLPKHYTLPAATK